MSNVYHPHVVFEQKVFRIMIYIPQQKIKEMMSFLINEL